MKNKIQLTIENPCHMNYEYMEKVDASCNFCHECATKVYDFSSCSEEDFLAIFKANNGNVCGRIQRPQSSITPPIYQQKSHKWTAWLFSLLAFIGFSTSSCKSTPEKVGKIEPVKSEMVVGKISDTSAVEAPKTH